MNPANQPPVSCLMITKSGRLDLIRQSIFCFDHQAYRNRELVIVHDSDSRNHDTIVQIAADFPNADISVYREPVGHTLGWLRNRSMKHARYALVCQWDDDDLYHPERLAKQCAALINDDADFCFLTDQLHLFVEKGYLFWDDWSIEAWPGNLIQGTLLGRKELLTQYPDIPRGEDTDVTRRIVSDGHRITTLSGKGWLYIYRYTGSNAWDFSHHAAISNWKRLGSDMLVERADTLNMELRRYELPENELVMPHEKGRVVIHLS